ncbi:MAG: hypothetical protein ACE5HQ_01125 [Gemmatimonadota bacterium]
MRISQFDNMPDSARVWIFGADRQLRPDDVARTRTHFETFLAEWAAHGQALTAAWSIVHGRFLAVAVDESRTAASGCSIDRLTEEIRRLESLLDVRLLETGAVWYRDAQGHIQWAARDEFRRLAEEGAVNGETIVFDLTVPSLAEYRSGRWELPASRSWHNRLLAARPGRRHAADGRDPAGGGNRASGGEEATTVHPASPPNQPTPL